MASCMGAALRRQLTVRPDLVRATRPASDKTSRCFMIAGSDTANGSASALIERSGSEGAVERSVAILNHVVKDRQARRAVKRTWTSLGAL